MNRPEILEKLHVASMKQPAGVHVWIYGSEARGEARIDSDVDLLVLVDTDKLSLRDEMAINEPFFDVELDTGVQINTHIETSKNWSTLKTLFAENVNRDKIAIA